jgi:hypothetical protein
MEDNIIQVDHLVIIDSPSPTAELNHELTSPQISCKSSHNNNDSSHSLDVMF